MHYGVWIVCFGKNKSSEKKKEGKKVEKKNIVWSLKKKTSETESKDWHLKKLKKKNEEWEKECDK